MQTIDRIVTVMRAVAAEPDGQTLSEVGRRAGLAPATCHRLLHGLAANDMVEKDACTRRWRMGLGMAQLARSVAPVPGFVQSADPVMSHLRDQWRECFFLTALVDGEVVCVRSATPPARDPTTAVTVALGRRLPLHAAATAKAILAMLDFEQAASLLETAPRQRFTRWTNTRTPRIKNELALVSQIGYATCDQEMEEGVLAFAVAAKGPPGEPPRGLGVIGHGHRLREHEKNGLIDDLRSAIDSFARSTLEPEWLAETMGA